VFPQCRDGIAGSLDDECDLALRTGSRELYSPGVLPRQLGALASRRAADVGTFRMRARGRMR
jgi:hypothetical protein